jgi:ABC-type branched-subunit amino acid transport system substrate-binding protein
MHRLIDEERVAAVVGNVGTPTAVAAVPIANAAKTPFYGAFTGAGVLRKTPPDRYVVNYRASYAEETAAMVDALVGQLGLRPQEIAFFTQRDAYGDAGFVGGITALKRRGLESEHDVAHGRYERNTLAVEDGLAEVMQADPPARAVILVGAYAPCARFIELAREFGVDALFLNVSFVGAAPLAAALGEKGEGVVVTQVVPHPDTDLPLIQEYRAALTAWKPRAEPTFGSLEGYVAARILIRALRSIQGPVTREAVIDALEGLGSFEIGLGVPLRLGPDEHQASHTVWPTILKGGRIQPLDWAALGGPPAAP